MEAEYEISLQELFSIVWNKIWLIILCMIIGAGIGFSVSKFIITPTYSSKVSMYVNNSKDRTEAALNINDINASQKLVATYIEILKSDTVLNKAIEEMALNYTTGQLRNMISASSVNGTEILEVKVISEDPEEAAEIANTLAKVAPAEIIRVVQAGNVELLDQAMVNHIPVGPNTKINTLIAALVGMLVSVIGVLGVELFDNRIKSADDLRKKYDLPVLGVIPDILEASKETK